MNESKQLENKRPFKLRLKGRKASLSLASFHASALGESVTPKVETKLKKVKASLKLKAKRAKYRQETRFYLCPGEYVNNAPASKGNEYACLASLLVDYKLVPAIDDKGQVIRNKDGTPVLIKEGGLEFRMDGTIYKELTLAKSYLLRSFKKWYKQRKGQTKFTFDFVTDVPNKTVSLILARRFDNDITHSAV